jgi:hypothetical protein
VELIEEHRQLTGWSYLTISGSQILPRIKWPPGVVKAQFTDEQFNKEKKARLEFWKKPGRNF